MDERNHPREVRDGVVVSLDYVLKVDGEVIDSSAGMEPIEFIQGKKQIIPGLESALYGMTVGARKEVTVQPEQGYGEFDPENFADINRADFPAGVPLQPGVELELTDENGEVYDGRIVSVDSANIRVDLNHPLAGKELHFSVRVVGLRQATAEELAHGHVHGQDFDEDDEEFDEWAEDDQEDST